MKKPPSQYAPISATDETEEEYADGIFTIDDDPDETQAENANQDNDLFERKSGPLEIESELLDENGIVSEEQVVLFEWKEPWLPSFMITICLETPILALSAWTFYQLIGRTWISAPFLFHLVVALQSNRLQMDGYWKVSSLSCIISTSLFLVVYKNVYETLVLGIFTDVDGTPVIEWSNERQRLLILRRMGVAAGMLRLIFGSLATSLRAMECWSCWGNGQSRISHRFWSFSRVSWLWKDRVISSCRRYVLVALVVFVCLLCWSLVSVVVHFSKWPPPKNNNHGCDPLDTTECWLPFPSFHHMQHDPSSETGWRVHLKGELLPRLKGGMKMDPHHLNRLDGFSTMGPILFYIKGLKEAYEAGVVGLQGHTHLAKSITEQSITLLIDVNSSSLVAHSAEVDYLDLVRPQIMMFPASPLKHGNHYAVAVLNARDAQGKLIPPTSGFSSLMANREVDVERYNRYMESVIPALEASAPWFSYDRGLTQLQLLFDFVTASELSQLGPVRAVRDATLAHIESRNWDWSAHHREINRIDYECSKPGTLLARTVHGELDVPWFLDCYGPGCREAVLNDDAVHTGKPVAVGAAKYIVHIPCSLRAHAINYNEGNPLKMVVEFGHGLFANRAESFDGFLQQLAHDKGYVLTAMEWRGMSLYDLLVVGKTLLSRPRLFHAVTDNLIQGYANKFALQHFSRSPAFLNSSMLYFTQDASSSNSFPVVHSNQLGYAFYGISQGGILGAGYAALSKGLLDRAVLGVPGTPFALVMSRSHDFIGYDLLMLLNIYDNRQVRMLLALCQMGWDSVEGAGVLAKPVRERIPPMLLQAGLGDAVVPTLAAEALARGLGARILEHNPRATIYGIERVDVSILMNSSTRVVLSEVLYEREFASLPTDDTIGKSNSVHFCVRRDYAMIHQVADFISNDRLSDPCIDDGCIRQSAWC